MYEVGVVRETHKNKTNARTHQPIDTSTHLSTPKNTFHAHSYPHSALNTQILLYLPFTHTQLPTPQIQKPPTPTPKSKNPQPLPPNAKNPTTKDTFPTSVEPVKETFWIEGCVHNRAPTEATFEALHVTTLNTPSGKPASLISCGG